MNIDDVMSRELETVGVDATIQSVAQKMAELDVAAFPVCEAGALKGIVTERDITTRVVATGRDPAATRAGEIMSSDVFMCKPDDPAEAVAEAMRERQIQQVPVVDSSGKLIGIVTAAHLMIGKDMAVEPARAARSVDDSASK